MRKKIKGTIAAGHESTAEAGIRIMDEGGNAFDAAVASILASFVAEPMMTSAGGGGYLNGFHASEHKHFFIDFFCQTPKWNKPLDEVDFYPVDIFFEQALEVFHIGHGSMAIPGCIAGVFSLHEHFGTMPVKILAEPAIELARSGVAVNDFQHYDFHLLKPIIDKCDDLHSVYYLGDDIIPTGEKLKIPQFADFLEVLAIEGPDLFYKGEVAKEVVRDCEIHGGYLRMEDFEDYEVHVKKPLTYPYRDFTVYTSPPPGRGGSILSHCMSLLEKHDEPHVPRSTNALSELQRIFSQTEKVFETNRKATEYQNSIYPDYPIRNDRRGNTTHLSIYDELGNAISSTTTLGQGSGYAIPGTQIMVNNMLGEGALFPEGFHSWPNNERVPSMMTPTIVVNQKDEVSAILGTGGSGRIPYSVFQVLVYLLDNRLDLPEAIQSPRIFWEKGVLNIEPGFESHIGFPEEVTKIEYWEKNDMFFGGVHTICRNSAGKIAAEGDARRVGVVRSNM